MSYHHFSVTLTPGQIKKLQSASKKNSGAKISFNSAALQCPNKLSLTEQQLRHYNDAKKSKTGVRLDIFANAISERAKTGGIFPLLAAIPMLIATAATAVAKEAALGAVGTTPGMH